MAEGRERGNRAYRRRPAFPNGDTRVTRRRLVQLTAPGAACRDRWPARTRALHREIKPANVLVDAESRRCLITDFGIARTADASALTATGMMVGTPAYLSPAQVRRHG